MPSRSIWPLEHVKLASEVFVWMFSIDMVMAGKCEDCIMGKQSRRPFDSVVTPESTPYERVAFDLWGPACVQTTGGKTLMLVATDYAGADCEVWFLASKTKEATAACLEAFDARVETQYGLRVKCVRTNSRREFENKLWETYC